MLRFQQKLLNSKRNRPRNRLLVLITTKKRKKIKFRIQLKKLSRIQHTLTESVNWVEWNPKRVKLITSILVHSRASQLPAPSILSDSESRVSVSRSDDDRADRLRYMAVAATRVRWWLWLYFFIFFLTAFKEENGRKKQSAISREPK